MLKEEGLELPGWLPGALAVTKVLQTLKAGSRSQVGVGKFLRWRAIILLSDCSGKVLTNRAVCVRVVPSVRKPTKEMTAIFSQMESAAGSWCGNR